MAQVEVGNWCSSLMLLLTLGCLWLPLSLSPWEQKPSVIHDEQW